MATTTLSYIDTNFHRIYDRTHTVIDQGLVTINNEFGKFGNSCLDFTNPDHKGIYFPNGLTYTNESFVVSAWIKLTSVVNNFVFIGNKEDPVDIDAWEAANDGAISSGSIDSTVQTNFTVSADNVHLVNAAIIDLEDQDWHHFVLTRVKTGSRDMLWQFVDGHMISETEIEPTKNIDFSELVIGCSGGKNPLIGYMDDFCFIKDAYIWLEDFTPPTVPLREDPVALESVAKLATQTSRTWSGSTDVIDVAANTNIATWELLELNKNFKLKFS